TRDARHRRHLPAGDRPRLRPRAGRGGARSRPARRKGDQSLPGRALRQAAPRRARAGQRLLSASGEPLLKVRGLNAGFDAGPVLFGIDLDVAPAELIALVGANGAGKSTFLGVVSGLVRATSGTIVLGGEDVTNERPEVLVRKGMAHVPQGRRLFGTISVEKKLILVEQDVLVALGVASRAYVLENGRVALSGAAAEVRDDRGVRKAYLGL